MHELIQLAYFSSVSSTWTPFDTASILQVSRKNNLRLSITGMLLFDKGNYLQVLEGNAKSVSQLFAVIEHDHRHVGVTEIFRQRIFRREFNEWAMAFRDLSLIEVSVAGYSDFLTGQCDLGSLDSQRTKDLFRLVRRLA